MVKTADVLSSDETREVSFSKKIKMFFELRIKIKHTAQILKTESPSKIAHAILEGDEPPKISFEKLRKRAQNLLKIKNEEGNWRLEDKERSGGPITVSTPQNIGRLKKMRRKSLRKVEVYTEKKSPAPTISKSTAGRIRKKHLKLNFFK